MKALLTAAQLWWQSITQREQRLLLVGAGLSLVGVLFWGVVQPLTMQAEHAQLRLASEKQLLSWVKDKADTVVSLRGSGNQAVSSTMPINQVVNTSARQFKIELIRVQPRNEMLQVWIQPLEFDQLLNWLAYLKQKHGLGVAFLDIEDTDKPGVVEVNRLQFGR